MENNIKIYCDGGSRGNPGASASAFIVYSEDGKIVYSQSVYLGIATNNIAEYKGVILALEWLLAQVDIKVPVPFYLDSQLIVNQLNGVYKIKEPKLLILAGIIKNLEKSLTCKISFKHIFRNENKDADLLVNQTLDASV